MIIIAHRGNLNGPNPDKENHPDYIEEALKAGFDVEIDVWCINGQYILGHDKPQYEVSYEFISNIKLWQHCKNITALTNLVESIEYLDVHCFYHNTDDVTLTTNCWLWTYPGKEITKNSIAVMPERVPGWDISKAAGVCTDFPYKYK
jgi:restriction endonuclease S subunit